MRTLLYTGFDEPYEKLAGITVPRMMEYAKRHGMDFICHRSYPLINVPNGIYWTGVCGALKAFEDGYDRAIYLDVDQLITNFDFSIDKHWPQVVGGIHVCQDWGEDAVDGSHFSACGIISHPDCHRLLKEVLAIEPEWRDKPFPEQAPLRHVLNREYKSNPKSKIFYWKRSPMNCVPDAVCPGNVPDPWTKSSWWCAHLTMVDIPRRIQIAKEILGKL